MKNKFILIPALLILSACTDSSQFKAVGLKGTPILNSEIIFTGTKGVMDVEYQPGTAWASIHTDVEVTQAVGGAYTIKRKDNGVKFDFMPEQYPTSNGYVCADCIKQGREALPMRWVLSDK